jgi:hypothetical protein
MGTSAKNDDTDIESKQENGAPEEIRTPDPQIRSLVLYPAELRALVTAAGLGPRNRALASL